MQEINLSKGQVINLSKGQVINLKKEDGTPVTRIVIGLGWSGKNGEDVDLDAYVRQYVGDEKYNVIFFNNKKANGILHHGDDLVGGGRAEDPNEVIDIDLLKIDAVVTMMDFGVNIFGGAGAMKEVTNTFIVIYDENTGEELIRYNMAVDFANATNVVAAKVVRVGSEWQLVGIGEGDQTGVDSIKGFGRARFDHANVPSRSNILSRDTAINSGVGTTCCPQTPDTRNWFQKLIDWLF